MDSRPLSRLVARSVAASSLESRSRQELNIFMFHFDDFLVIWAAATVGGRDGVEKLSSGRSEPGVSVDASEEVNEGIDGKGGGMTVT